MYLFTHIHRWKRPIGIAVLALACLLSGCRKRDDHPVSADTGKAVWLRIALPRPIDIPLGTKSGAADFNQITDLNVAIADGNSDNAAIEGILYFDHTGSDTGDPNVVFRDKAVDIHFSSEYASAMELASKTLYIVANYGQTLSTGGPATVAELKSLKQETLQHGIPVGSILFGKAARSSNHTHADTGDTGITLEAELIRTVAMVTIEIDGSGLAENTFITPTGISLHRVPKSCFIGKDNEHLVPSEIIENGSFKDGGFLNWKTIAGDLTQGDFPSVAGGHYAEDFTDQSIAPLFLLENLHGGDEFVNPDSDQKSKRPVGCGSDDPESIEQATPTCSYLKVSANYRRLDATGDILVTGKVSFKLFLGNGSDAGSQYDFGNFDVTRNHYYKVTLDLDGYAVTEGGEIGSDGELTPNPEAITWRVDSELGEVSIITSDINLNASGEFFPVDVAAASDVTFTLSVTDLSFRLWVYSPAGWTTAGGQNMTDIPLIANEGKIWFYMPSNKWGDNISTKTATITLTNNKTGVTQSITMVQHKPLEITVTSEEFPFIETVFGERSLTLYIDRVDREPLPWGFYGEVLEHNDTDGFANALHLVDKSEHNHWRMAQTYLPFGKATKNPDETVDEDGGSALVYALMLYPYQTMGSAPNLPMGEVLNRTEFPEIVYDRYNLAQFCWTVPSIVEWQMIEKLSDQGKLDPAYPIYSFMQYWTSDAVTTASEPDNGKERAYTYQLGQGLDALTTGSTYPKSQISDRRRALRFRLISVRPNVILE